MDFDALLKRLQAMPWANQWRLLAGLALLVVGALGLGIWGFSPDYAPLYPSLAEKDSGAVMAALDQNGYGYKLSSNGAIQVERTKVYEARYKLAALGLPKTAQDESGEPPKFGATSIQEQAYQQKIKEIELGRTINGISGISGARVHLALPHQTIFGKETTPTTASVVIDSAGGVSRSQAAAIAHLVANATPGLRTADVSIIDGQGKLLTEDADNAGDTPEQRTYTKEFRSDLQARVEHLLTPLVGEGKAKAEIDVDLEFGNEEAVTESWRPNSGEAAIRSQQSSDSKNTNSTASGIPGSATNTLPLALPPLPNQTTQPRSEIGGGASQSVTNYELDRSVTKSIRKGVKIRKIRAAILVDYKKTLGKDGKSTSVPMSSAELVKIQSLIQESIGLDEDRGDSIQVMNSPFLENAAPSDDAGPPLWKDPYLIELALLIGKWLAIILGLAWFAKTARNLLTQLSAGDEDKDGEGLGGDDKGDDLVRAGGTPVEASIDLAAVRQVAQGNPQAVASVIKGWVEGDGNE